MRFARASGIWLLLVTLVALSIGSPTTHAADDPTKSSGYVDRTAFTGLVGEDDLQIEIWLPGSLLKIAGAFDPDLAELVKGLELAQAVVVETQDSEVTRKLEETVRATEQQLLRKGWVRLAKIKDGTEAVSVLILSVDEVIHGLVVMVSDRGAGGEFVFANVSGVIDLAALQRLGAEMSLPGLDRIEANP